MDGFKITDFKQIKEDEFENLKGDNEPNGSLAVEEKQDLSSKLAEQILELINMEEISNTVNNIKNPKVHVEQRVFLQKREEKKSESLEILTMVNKKCSVVEEHKQGEQRRILSSKYPLSEKCSKCPICIKSFSDRSALTRHTKTHNKKKTFVCFECNKPFHRPSHLRDHAKIHNNINRHKCDLCDMTFVQYGQLKVHILGHTGFKDFSCDVCKSSFTRNESLLSHVNSHTKHKKFKCKFCTERFGYRSSLRKHEKRTHLKEKPHKCQYCILGFVDTSDLGKHMSRRHKNEKI